MQEVDYNISLPDGSVYVYPYPVVVSVQFLSRAVRKEQKMG